MQQYGLIINGEKILTSESFDVINPSTGELVAKAPKASIDHLNQAVSAAENAFKTFSKTSDEERQNYCLAIAAKLEEHADELAKILTQEQGKPLNGLGSRWELGGAQAWTGYTASLSLPVEILQDNDEGKLEMHRKPIGVVGSITPWNFPLLIAIWHIIPAIRTGNTVVCKPSPFAPLTTLRAIEIMNEVLPKGVLNCITGDDEIGIGIARHEDIGKIVFTGSCATGQNIMSRAAPTMKRLTLEMGGNDAGIVLADCDPKEIAEGLFWGAFINSGQTCACIKRLYIHADIYEEVANELVNFAKNIPMGDGLDEKSILGPIANEMQFDKVTRLVNSAKETGRVLLGGQAPAEQNGYFFPVTIIADMKNGDPLVDEEQFGPALPLIKFTDIDEAIEMANDTETGLGASVWSKDIEAAKRIALQLESGSVWINKHGAIQPNAPFGGVKSSGFGIEFGEEGLKSYTDIQVIFA